MADRIWIGTDGAYSTAGNWSPSGVPAAGENVRIPAGSGSITSGLDQSAVEIGYFIVEEGYTGTIGVAGSNGGLPTYLQIDCDRFEYAGGTKSWIDVTDSAIPIEVKKTAPGGTGTRGLYLKGSAITTLSVMAGSVGLAVHHTETSTATTIRVCGDSASVWAGAGVTLTNFYMTRGSGEMRCSASTGVTIHGGTFRSTEVGTIGTLTIDGGTAYPESTGTITTLNADGGTVDFTGSSESRTVTTFKQNPGSTVIYDPAVITMTNRSAPDDPVSLTASLPR